MQESDAKRPRGRSAIQAAHGGLTIEDEARLDLMICDLYGVDSDEASEIHLNYHVDRMLAALTRRCAEKGISNEVVADRLRYVDVLGTANQVSKGRLSEPAAIDALFRSLQAAESQDRDDRYISFYG